MQTLLRRYQSTVALAAPHTHRHLSLSPPTHRQTELEHTKSHPSTTLPLPLPLQTRQTARLSLLDAITLPSPAMKLKLNTSRAALSSNNGAASSTPLSQTAPPQPPPPTPSGTTTPSLKLNFKASQPPTPAAGVEQSFSIPLAPSSAGIAGKAKKTARRQQERQNQQQQHEEARLSRRCHLPSGQTPYHRLAQSLSQTRQLLPDQRRSRSKRCDPLRQPPAQTLPQAPAYAAQTPHPQRQAAPSPSLTGPRLRQRRQ